MKPDVVGAPKPRYELRGNQLQLSPFPFLHSSASRMTSSAKTSNPSRRVSLPAVARSNSLSVSTPSNFASSFTSSRLPSQSADDFALSNWCLTDDQALISRPKLSASRGKGKGRQLSGSGQPSMVAIPPLMHRSLSFGNDTSSSAPSFSSRITGEPGSSRDASPLASPGPSRSRHRIKTEDDESGQELRMSSPRRSNTPKTAATGSVTRIKPKERKFWTAEETAVLVEGCNKVRSRR